MIFEDVDIPEAADKLAQAITFHTGQSAATPPVGWCKSRSTTISRTLPSSASRRYRSAIRLAKRPRWAWSSATSSMPRSATSKRHGSCGLSSRWRRANRGCEGGHVTPALLAGSLDNVRYARYFGPAAYLAPFSNESEGIRFNNTATAWLIASGQATSHAVNACFYPRLAMAGSTHTTYLSRGSMLV